MNPTPLKGKTYLITANKVEDNAFMFYCIDVAAAVEWLKLKISHIGFSYELIDEAFEDIVNPANSQTFSKAKSVVDKKRGWDENV